MSILIAYILIIYPFMFGFIFLVDDEVGIKNLKGWLLFLAAPVSAIVFFGAFARREIS